MQDPQYMVAIVGAGPAGLYAARKLVEGGARVVLFNRDIKPGGLAEYGIYPDKLKLKFGLRAQFQQILDLPAIDYFGNVTVCCGGIIVLEDLLESGFQAVLITTGAQGTKWLRLPGENLPGVYHAKNIIFHNNLLPPFSEKKYLLGKRVAVVGAGNVMLDVAHYLVRDRKVDEVIAVVRRGPGEVKFTRKEMETVARNLDLACIACAARLNIAIHTNQGIIFHFQCIYAVHPIAQHAHGRSQELEAEARLGDRLERFWQCIQKGGFGNCRVLIGSPHDGNDTLEFAL